MAGTRCDCPFASRDEAAFIDKTFAERDRGRAPPKVTSDPELTARARVLLAKYLPEIAPPASIQWSLRMKCSRRRAKWGVCYPSKRAIRISAVLKQLPGWVRDSVIVHELAHLKERNHGPEFWKLANRYPGTAKERAFLRQYMATLEDDAGDAGITIRREQRPAARGRRGTPRSQQALASSARPVVGAVVMFGRPQGEKTRARVVRLGPSSAVVELLEPRGRGRGGAVGTRWRVPYRLLESVAASRRRAASRSHGLRTRRRVRPRKRATSRTRR